MSPATRPRARSTWICSRRSGQRRNCTSSSTRASGCDSGPEAIMAFRRFLLLCVLVLLIGCGKEQGVLVVTTKEIMDATKGPAGEGNRRWKGRVLQITGPVKDA